MKQLSFDVIGKVCTKCGKWKPLNEFHKHQTGKYGCRPTCKVCRSVPKTPYQLEYEKLAKYDLRRCRECEQIKSLDEFYDYGAEKGRYYTCKNCMYPGRLHRHEQNRLFQEGKKRCNTCNEIKGLHEFRFRADRQTYEFECNICRNSRIKEYNARNPDNVKARRQRWLDKKLKQDPNYSHNRYMQHRARNQVHNRIYYAENKECLRAYSRQYYIEHKDKVKAYQRKYNAKYPDKIRARKIARRTRETGAGGSFTTEEWQALCKRYGNRCLCCGEIKPLTRDHVVPVSKGGNSDISNLQCLCKSCNCKKHDKIIDYRPDYQRRTCQLSQVIPSSVK